MKPERWKRIQTIFDAALERPADERGAFLDGELEGEPEIRAEVESLLDSFETDPGYLEQPVGCLSDLEQAEAEGSMAGRRLGPYRVERRIGVGGMGSVYLAERDDDRYRQQVAIKLVKRGMDTEHVLRRFAGEQHILAHLEHPNVARILDAGTSEDGRPFFAMEFVDGKPIDRHCRDAGLSLTQRLELFEDVCEAVQYAHQNLVVHRDLKPSNILVSEDGRVKLLDFGIAKLLDPDKLPFEMTLTHAEARVVTPQYASPEQLRGEAITTASDIYSLGVLLYQLITDERPYRITTGSTAEMVKAMEERKLQPPSAVAGRWRSRLRGDLDTIAMMALRRDASRRYTSAQALADDLRRYRRGHPVRAHKDSAGYRLRRFVARNRWGVAVASGFAVLIIAFGVYAALTARRVRDERDRAQAEADKAEAVVETLVGLFASTSPVANQDGDEISIDEFLERGSESVSALEDQPEVQARMWQVLGNIQMTRSRYDEAAELLAKAVSEHEVQGTLESLEGAKAAHILAMNVNRGEGARAAEPLLRESLERYRAIYGDDHLDVAQCMQDLASVVESREEKRELAQATLAIRLRHLPADHVTIASSYNQLAIVDIDEGRLDGAIDNFERALAILSSQLPADHPHVLAVRGNLSTMYGRQARWEEAEAIWRENLARARRSTGERSSQVAVGLEALGIVLAHQGRLEEAQASFEESLALFTEMLGNSHFRLANSYRNLGVLVSRRGDFETGISHLERSREIFVAAQGEGSRGDAYMRGQIAQVLGWSGQPERALEEVSAAVADLERIQPEEYYSGKAFSYSWLGTLQLQNGRPVEAEASFARCQELLRKVFFEEHPRAAEARCGIGLARIDRGEHEAGEALVRSNYTVFARWGLAEPGLLERCERVVAGEAR